MLTVLVSDSQTELRRKEATLSAAQGSQQQQKQLVTGWHVTQGSKHMGHRSRPLPSKEGLIKMIGVKIN